MHHAIPKLQLWSLRNLLEYIISRDLLVRGTPVSLSADSLSLWSINKPKIIKNRQIKSTIYGSFRGPCRTLRPPSGFWGALTHQSHDKMCSNEFSHQGVNFRYNMPTILKNWQIHNLQAFQGPLRSLKVPKREPWGPLTFKFHGMICSNEFPYQWDQFWYIYHI